MTTEYPNLIHDPNCFRRETLEARMKAVGVKNIARMELFLWDLEIFLQLQNILGEKLVLSCTKRYPHFPSCTRKICQ